MTRPTTMSVNIYEAKTHLSRYLNKVEEGNVILLCRKGYPIAEIRSVSPKKHQKKRLFGLGKGKGHIPDSFFDELTDEDFPGIGL